jgi:hypothetical protein
MGGPQLRDSLHANGHEARSSPDRAPRLVGHAARFHFVLHHVDACTDELASPAHESRVREVVPEFSHGAASARAGDDPCRYTGERPQERLKRVPLLGANQQMEVIRAVCKFVDPDAVAACK